MRFRHRESRFWRTRINRFLFRREIRWILILRIWVCRLFRKKKMIRNAWSRERFRLLFRNWVKNWMRRIRRISFFCSRFIRIRRIWKLRLKIIRILVMIRLKLFKNVIVLLKKISKKTILVMKLIIFNSYILKRTCKIYNKTLKKAKTSKI